MHLGRLEVWAHTRMRERPSGMAVFGNVTENHCILEYNSKRGDRSEVQMHQSAQMCKCYGIRAINDALKLTHWAVLLPT